MYGKVEEREGEKSGVTENTSERTNERKRKRDRERPECVGGREVRIREEGIRRRSPVIELTVKFSLHLF